MLDSSQKLLPADELKKRFDQEGKNSSLSLSLSLSLSVTSPPTPGPQGFTS